MYYTGFDFFIIIAYGIASYSDWVVESVRLYCVLSRNSRRRSFQGIKFMLDLFLRQKHISIVSFRLSSLPIEDYKWIKVPQAMDRIATSFGVQ